VNMVAVFVSERLHMVRCVAPQDRVAFLAQYSGCEVRLNWRHSYGGWIEEVADEDIYHMIFYPPL